MKSNDIAKRIKIIRVRKGITQEVVYESTGINIARIELDKCSPTIKTLEKICEYFDTPLSELLASLKHEYFKLI